MQFLQSLEIIGISSFFWVKIIGLRAGLIGQSNGPDFKTSSLSLIHRGQVGPRARLASGLGQAKFQWARRASSHWASNWMLLFSRVGCNLLFIYWKVQGSVSWAHEYHIGKAILIRVFFGNKKAQKTQVFFFLIFYIHLG